MLMNLIALIEEQNLIENHVYVICKLQYIEIFDRSNFDELIIRTPWGPDFLLNILLFIYTFDTF